MTSESRQTALFLLWMLAVLAAAYFCALGLLTAILEQF